MNNEMLFEDICWHYFATRGYDCCKRVYGGGVVITAVGDDYAFYYKSWEELYTNDVRWQIKDDCEDIGIEEVRDYLGEEEFEFVRKDLRLESEVQ